VTVSIAGFDAATDEVIEFTAETQKEVVNAIVETFFGIGAFAELYEKAGKSSTNLMSLVHYLNELYIDEEKKKADNARDKYLSNVKK
ncbi:hypothetical protein, partial [Cronobacter sakazakii]